MPTLAGAGFAAASVAALMPTLAGAGFAAAGVAALMPTLAGAGFAAASAPTAQPRVAAETASTTLAGGGAAAPGTPGTFALPGTVPPPTATLPANCLRSGDGYLRARVAGAVEARINWTNSGLRCQGEARVTPPGVRLSFQRRGAKPDLLFVFGLTGVMEGRAAHAVATNLTVIVQGTDRIYGTLGDSRCTVDSLSQRRLGPGKSYRLEARGFCTQPAHAVRGDDALLVSTFEFAGLVNYDGSGEGGNPEGNSANP
jgi:hypothetical protein